MKKVLAFIISIIMIAEGIISLSEKEADNMSFYAVDLQTEYMTNPLGIDEAVPRLSWIIISNKRAVTQTAYRVIVSKSKENILNGIGDIWDSGKVSTDKSVGIEYGGEALESKTAYFWAVRVWDNYGNESYYSAPASFETAMLDGEWEAEWITTEKSELSDNSSLPVFGKNFTADSNKTVESARAYASGLGMFEMHLNGCKVTDAVFEPGETNFDKKAFYVTYDITDSIKRGENAVGVYIGKGFYHNPSIIGRYNRSPKIWGPLMFLAQIEINYTDGTKDIIVTDESWKYAYGPVRESVWLGGEDYDANYEIENFALPEWNLSKWNNAVTVLESDYPFERLEAKMFPSIKVVDTAEVDSITETATSDGTKSYTVKFNRNFAGLYSFTADFPEGTKITFRPGENINSDGTVNQSSAIMWGSSGTIYDTYTFSGKGMQTYTPKFVYHGFQYLQIDGAPKAVTTDMLKGMIVRCDNEIAGSLSASDKNVTKVHEMITNSISDNMFNVITDCPHREKLGWLEVSHLMYPSISANFNVAAYMEKISDDMIDAQKDSGSIPSIVPPLTVGKSEHALRDNSDDDTPNDPSWCGASIMVPWYTYLTYGDTRQLEKAYGSMAKYFDYLTSLTVKSSTPYILESGDLTQRFGRLDER